jgi:hypothetical protein
LTNGGRNLGLNGTDFDKDDESYIKIYNGITNPDDLDKITREKTRQNVIGNTLSMFKDWVQGLVKNTKKKDACKHLNEDLSYFKLPTYYAKKGGGIRVKRLLSYDPGIAGETGDAMIYGSEYLYQDESGNSSGVATNEPAVGREENTLVDFIERKRQKTMDKLLNGQDLKQFEGPIGESILPSASVVHSMVIVKNIHTGRTTTGFAVNKYHTCREFPMLIEYSVIAKSNNTYKKSKISLPLGLFNMSINKAWVTQGYLFRQNDMHGKLKSQTTYAGNYTPNFQQGAFTAQTVYNYSAPGQKVMSMIYDPATAKMETSMLNPGTEEDLTMLMSNVDERTNDFSVELDLNIGYFPPYMSLGFGLSYSFTENMLSQHVTSKIVSENTHLLSTTTTKDGISQTTENLAFDKYTGDPVLTRTFDGYMGSQKSIRTQQENAMHDGHYYALNIPASWIYPQMGPKSENANNSNQLTAAAGSVVTYGGNKLYNAIVGSGSWNAVNDKLENVVSASSTIYQNNWFKDVDLSEYIPGIGTDKVTELKEVLNKRMYPYRSYVYRDDVYDANQTKIYSGGTYKNPLEFMKWDLVSNSTNIDHSQNTSSGSIVAKNEIDKWYSPTQIMAYSPNGIPLEEKDVLGISSSAKFGYEHTLPILVAQNAKYPEVIYKDFEARNEANGVIDANNNKGITTATAHTGQGSYDLQSDKNYVFAKNYEISQKMIDSKGLALKLWLKSDLGGANAGLKNQNPQLMALIGGKSFPFKRIAETGEWALYSADIQRSSFNGLGAGSYDVQLSYNFNSPSEQVFVDDFRMQPLNASMNCTVYTTDQKVAAQFDDQHFATLYEYNLKGQLVRKSVETERGKKTIQEQQYNTPVLNR